MGPWAGGGLYCGFVDTLEMTVPREGDYTDSGASRVMAVSGCAGTDVNNQAARSQCSQFMKFSYTFLTPSCSRSGTDGDRDPGRVGEGRGGDYT